MAIDFPASPTVGDTKAAFGKTWEWNGTGWVLQVADPAAVTSVNGATGDVVLAASDVGAEPAITAGTTAQYWRGDKSWQTLDKSAVGLSNVDDTSDAGKPVSTAQQAALDALIPSGYIDGLQLSWVSSTAITVKSGAATIQSTGKVLRATSDIAKTGLSLSASTWYHVYVYDNAGTPAAEVVTTAPASPYNGTARSKTSDTSRRYVGSVLTDASGNIYKFTFTDGVMMFLNSIADVPFLVVATGRATTATNIACSGCVPVTSKIGVVIMATLAATTADAAIGNSEMTGALSSTNYLQYVGAGVQTTHFMPLDSSQRFSYRMTASTSSGGFFARVCGYIMER